MSFRLPVEKQTTDKRPSILHPKILCPPLALTSKRRQSRPADRNVIHDLSHSTHEEINEAEAPKSNPKTTKQQAGKLLTSNHLVGQNCKAEDLETKPVLLIPKSALANYLENSGVCMAFELIFLEVLSKKIPRRSALKYTTSRFKEFGEAYERFRADSHPKQSAQI